MSQKWKYDELYDGRNPHYGKTNHGKEAYSFLPLDIGSIVDIGCGDNSFISHFESYAVGVDFASPLADVKADATNLSFAEKEFTWLTAFDVLEHLEENDIDKALKEFQRVAHCYCFSICYEDSSTKASDGSTLHPTVKPEEWWIDKISQFGTVEKVKQYLVGAFINK